MREISTWVEDIIHKHVACRDTHTQLVSETTLTVDSGPVYHITSRYCVARAAVLLSFRLEHLDLEAVLAGGTGTGTGPSVIHRHRHGRTGAGTLRYLAVAVEMPP